MKLFLVILLAALVVATESRDGRKGISEKRFLNFVGSWVDNSVKKPAHNLLNSLLAKVSLSLKSVSLDDLSQSLGNFPDIIVSIPGQNPLVQAVHANLLDNILDFMGLPIPFFQATLGFRFLNSFLKGNSNKNG